MKVKNLILFGFVLSAISYLSKQMEEDSLKDEIDLEDVDLEEIKKELGDRLEKSVAEFGDVVSAIVGIGSDAFERFLGGNETVSNQEEFENVQKQFDKVFQSLDEEETVELTTQQQFNKVFALDEEEDEEIDDSIFETVLENEVEEVVENPLLEDLKEILETIEEEEIEEENFDEDEIFNRIQQAIAKANFDHQEEFVEEKPSVEESHKEASLQEIEDIFSEILESEDLEEEVVVEDDAQEYIDDLIDELKDHYEVEKEETVKDIYDQINDLYPYLSKGFVRSVYDLKESIALEYPLNRMVIALHRIRFVNLEDLHQFIEIVTNHDYGVNVDENEMIVDLFKEYRNTDGKILTNIFEIANQAKLLRGDYEGYRIEVLEK